MPNFVKIYCQMKKFFTQALNSDRSVFMVWYRPFRQMSSFLVGKVRECIEAIIGLMGFPLVSNETLSSNSVDLVKISNFFHSSVLPMSKSWNIGNGGRYSDSMQSTESTISSLWRWNLRGRCPVMTSTMLISSFLRQSRNFLVCQ